MTRKDVWLWMCEHPECFDGEPDALLALCECEIREHAAEDAWGRARRVVERRHRAWKDRRAAHASPGYVACEVCSRLAEDLSHMAPTVEEGAEASFLDDDLRTALEPEALREMKDWIREIASLEEQRQWREIVRFTRHRGRAIAIEQHLGFDTDWRSTRDYARTAAMVTRILSEDYARHMAFH